MRLAYDLRRWCGTVSYNLYWNAQKTAVFLLCSQPTHLIKRWNKVVVIITPQQVYSRSLNPSGERLKIGRFSPVLATYTFN